MPSPRSLLVLGMLLAACSTSCRDKGKNDADPTGTQPAVPSKVQLIADGLPPLSWVRLDGDAILYAAEESGRTKVRRMPKTGGQAQDIATFPKAQAFEFAMDDEAYYYADGASVFRAPRAGGPARAVARFPREVRDLGIDAAHVYAFLDQKIELTPAKDSPPGTITVTGANQTGGGIYRVSKRADGGTPALFAAAPLAAHMKVARDRVYWVEAFSMALHGQPTSPDAGAERGPLTEEAIEYLADEAGVAFVRRKFQKGVETVSLYALPPSGPPEILVADEKMIHLYTIDATRIFYRTLHGIRRVDRKGGTPVEVTAPPDAYFGFDADATHAYVGVSGAAHGKPSFRLVRVEL